MKRRWLFLSPDAPAAAGGGGAPPAGGAGSPPAGAGTPPGTGAPVGAPAGGGDEPSSFDKFDEHFADLETPKPPTPPAKPPAAGTPPKPGQAQPPKGAPPGKPAGAPAKQEFEEVEGIQVPKFKKDGEFRSWGLNGYKKAKQLETELATANSKLTELQQRIPKDPNEREALATRIAGLEKTVQEREQQIKYLNYERSQEYEEKYRKPYLSAIREAHAEIKELTISEPDPSQPPDADGKQKLRERAATPDDFDHIYQLPLGAATKLAREMFGDAAPVVLGHRKAIRDLAKSAVSALEEWRSKAAEREKAENERTSVENNQVQSFWLKANEKFSTDPRVKDDWGDEPEDKELTAELDKGFALADRRFSDEYLKLPVVERMLLDAKIRHCVAGFYKQRFLVRRLKTQLEEANKALEQYRGSEPGAPGSGGAPEGGAGDKGTESEGAMAEFDKRL